MAKPTSEQFNKLRDIIENGKQEVSGEQPTTYIGDATVPEEPQRMRWRKVDEHHIKSDQGFTISKTGDVYTCWAPANCRVRGVKIHTGLIGFHYCKDGEEAKEACQKLYANPEDFVPAEDGELHDSDCGAVEPAREDQTGSVRVHRHSGFAEPDDSGHTDLFAQ